MLERSNKPSFSGGFYHSQKGTALNGLIQPKAKNERSRIGGIDQYTKAMLHMDGANATTVFTDNSLSPKVWTANGNAQISTVQSKFGGASALFDGAGDWIDTLSHNDFNISANFLIDFQIKRNALGTTQYVCGRSDSAGVNTAIAMLVSFNTSNKVLATICSGATGYQITSTNAIADTTTWHHVEFNRTGNTLRLFIDGVLNGTLDVTGVTANNPANKFAIGRLGEYATGYLSAYVDEFRFNNGIGGHTADFVPPVNPYYL